MSAAEQAPHRFDPLLAHGLLQLFGPFRAVAMIANHLGEGSTGVVLWFYDPRNRVFSPRFSPHATTAEGIAAAVIRLLDKQDVTAELRETLKLVETWVQEAKERKEGKKA